MARLGTGSTTRRRTSTTGSEPAYAPICPLRTPCIMLSLRVVHWHDLIGWRNGRDRIVVSTSRCGRDNPGSNPGHGRGCGSLTRHGQHFCKTVQYIPHSYYVRYLDNQVRLHLYTFKHNTNTMGNLCPKNKATSVSGMDFRTCHLQYCWYEQC